MKFLQILFASLLASAFFLTAPNLYRATVAKAQTTTQTPTGYPTGTICPKTGTYRARNQYTEIILVVTKGKAFPPFSDGSKTIWYAITKEDEK
jgi:hypothetical protein